MVAVFLALAGSACANPPTGISPTQPEPMLAAPVPATEEAQAPRADHGSGTWQTGANIPVEIAEIAAAALGESIYTGGGFTPPGGSIGRWFGRYEVAADRWTERAALPLGVHHPGMAAASGRIWLSGGYTGTLNTANASRQLHAYDPANDTWTRKTDMPGRRAAHGLAAISEELYAAGGIGDATDRLWIYDIASDTWRDVPGPMPREHLGVAASGGLLYVIAGRGFGRGNIGFLEAFDPATAAWSRLPDMPGGCGGCSAAATEDGQVHITGGEGGGKTYGEHAVFDPAEGSWHVAAPLPTTRHGIGAAAVGDRFYVIGGGRTQGLAYSNVVEWWSPDAAAPTATAGATASPAATLWPPAFAPLLARGWRR
jgi:hypothetical protein